MRPRHTGRRVKAACLTQPSLCVGERWFRRRTTKRQLIRQMCAAEPTSVASRPSVRLPGHLRREVRRETCAPTRCADIEAQLRVPGVCVPGAVAQASCFTTEVSMKSLTAVAVGLSSMLANGAASAQNGNMMNGGGMWGGGGGMRGGGGRR